MLSTFTCATGFFYTLFSMIHNPSFAFLMTINIQILCIVLKYSFYFKPMRTPCESFPHAENQNVREEKHVYVFNITQ